MKKIFSVLLITTIVTTLGSPVYASSQNPSDLQECIENTMFYNNEYRLFNEFTYQGMEINLLPETTITKEEALIKYKEAYDYIAGKAMNFNNMLKVMLYQLLLIMNLMIN